MYRQSVSWAGVPNLTLFVFLLMSTVLRYVEVFDINLYFWSAAVIFTMHFSKFTVSIGEMLLFCVLVSYLLLGNIFLDFRVGASLLVASNFFIYLVARNLIGIYGIHVFVRMLVIVSTLHVVVALMQFVFRDRYMLPSHYFEIERDLGSAAVELALEKPSGLSLLASQFHLCASFLVAYLLEKRRSVFSMVVVVFLSFINLGKIFFAVALLMAIIRPLIVRVSSTVAIIFVLVVVFVQYPLLIVKFGATPENVSTWTERIMIFRAAMLLYESAPWFGIGLDQFKSAATTYDLSQFGFPVRTDAHNIYLKAVVELGIVGVVGILLILNLCLRKLEADCSFGCFVRAAAILVLVQSGYHNFQYYNEIPLLMALVVSCTRESVASRRIKQGVSL